MPEYSQSTSQTLSPVSSRFAAGRVAMAWFERDRRRGEGVARLSRPCRIAWWRGVSAAPAPRARAHRRRSWRRARAAKQRPGRRAGGGGPAPTRSSAPGATSCSGVSGCAFDEARQHHAVGAEMDDLGRDAGRCRGAGVRLFGAAVDDRGGAVAGNAQREAAVGEIDLVDAVGEPGEAGDPRRFAAASPRNPGMSASRRRAASSSSSTLLFHGPDHSRFRAEERRHGTRPAALPAAHFCKRQRIGDGGALRAKVPGLLGRRAGSAASRRTMRRPTKCWSHGFSARPRTAPTKTRASPRAPSATSRRSAMRAAASAGLRTSCTITASPPRRGWR